MRTEDIIKVLKAGFSVVRPADTPTPRIEYHDGKNWILEAEYPDREKRDIALQELLNFGSVLLD